MGGSVILVIIIILSAYVWPGWALEKESNDETTGNKNADNSPEGFVGFKSKK